MATLLELRTKMNFELGVANDGDEDPWPVAARNNAISDGYAALWRVGVWKDVTIDLAAVADAHIYATTIRRLGRVELLDSSLLRLGPVRAGIEPDWAGTGLNQLRLTNTIDSGQTIRVYGWTAYKSDFGQNDAVTDDLPAEHNRIPLLKAKAICYRASLGSFIRYGSKQIVPPEMSVTADQMLGVIAAAEREFELEARALSGLRPRSGQPRRL